MSLRLSTLGSLRTERRVKNVALVAAVVLALACSTTEAPGPIEPGGPVGRVRFVNLITDTTRGRINAALENLPFGVNLLHGTAIPASLAAPSAAFYAPIYAGNRTLLLERTIDTSVTVLTVTFTVAGGQDRTIYATGGAGASAITEFITTDTNPTPVATEVRFRVVNMTAGAVDVFFTASGADLAAATPNVAALAPQGVSGYLVLAPGSYQIRMVPAGTAAAARAANVTVNIAAAAYAGGTGRTIVAATSSTGGTPLKGIVLGDR